MVACKVEIRNASLSLSHNGRGDLKQQCINFLTKRKIEQSKVVICDNVNLTLKPGDRLGLLGSNGSGKSSLLKVICGIYPPDDGCVEIVGSIFPLIELGAGFNGELTGEENAYLYGALCGLPKESANSVIDEVFSFAELENFRYDLVKNYSSGMYARLAFSLATSVPSDILLLDEIFATGDLNFAQKALKRLEGLLARTKIVVVVSHDAEILRKYCNRYIWLDQGKVFDASDDPSLLDRYVEYQLSR